MERQRRLEAQLDALRDANTRAPAADAEPAAPLAGYSSKNFFLRDANDWFVLMPKGRLNVDSYNFLSRPPDPPLGVASNSAADQRPKNTIFIRRARVGFAGTIARHIDFRMETEFATTRTPGQYADTTDASIVLNWTPLLQLEVGQFYTPFTLENPTSENYGDFMEKASPVRYAVPSSREIGLMVFGEAPQQVARYWIGAFNGDGQNYKNLDNQPAIIGRATLSPLALIPEHPQWQSNVWVGGSFWTQKSTNLGGAAAPSTTATQGDIASVTTQAGVSVFNSTYANGTDAANNAIRTHLAPDGRITKYALELNLPVFEQSVGLRAEYIYQSIDLSQYNDTATARAKAGSGKLSGAGGYVEAYAWIGEKIDVDLPGLYRVPHWSGYVAPPPPRWAVMLAAKYEHLGFDVDGLPNGKKAPDPASGSYSLDVFELGGSLWYTRHSRIMANYVLNYIGAVDNSAAVAQKGPFFRKTDHELLFRFAVSL